MSASPASGTSTSVVSTPIELPPGSPRHRFCAFLTGNQAVAAYIAETYAGYGIDTFSGCVRTFAKGTPIVVDEINEPDGFGGDAMQQCAFLETQGVAYPFVFAEDPGAPSGPRTASNARAPSSRSMRQVWSSGALPDDANHLATQIARVATIAGEGAPVAPSLRA